MTFLAFLSFLLILALLAFVKYTPKELGFVLDPFLAFLSFLLILALLAKMAIFDILAILVDFERPRIARGRHFRTPKRGAYAQAKTNRK